MARVNKNNQYTGTIGNITYYTRKGSDKVFQQIAKGTIINHLPLTIHHLKGVYVVKVGNVTERVIIK